MKTPFYKQLFHRKTLFRTTFALGSLLLAVPLLPPPSLFAQTTPVSATNSTRESFLAIQKQVETIQPTLTRSTVAIFAGGGFGSGVIVTPDGIVLTAAHVISGQQGRRMQVTLEDGRSFPATYLGADKQSDLGIIQIANAKNLPTVPIGDSATLRSGQWIVATGHPLGRRPGRPPVLRLGRVFTTSEMETTRRDRQRIATDATLLNGDSGGPLFDLNGRVVGIHSMITGGRFQASIHIPVNLSKDAIERVRAGSAPLTWEGPSSTFKAAFSAGQESFQAGDLKGAIRSARRATETDPSSALAQLLLARSLARNGEQGPAATALRESLKDGFNDVTELRDDKDLNRLLDEPALARQLNRLDIINAIPGERKSDQYFRTATRRVAMGTDHGIVRIQSGGNDVALGTILSADGDILTKASELPEGPLECVLPDGKIVSAERRSDDVDWDVSLLKVEASDLEPITFSGSTPVGLWTFSPDGTDSPAKVGVVGVSSMPVRDRGIASRPTSKAYMGIRMEPVRPDALSAAGLSQGVRVEVEENLPAARAGIQDGDILFEMDGRPIQSPDSFMDMMVSKQPGDTTRVRLARGDTKLDVTINLTARPRGIPGRGGMIEMLSGEVSRRSGPFPHVLHHDTVLLPNAMGGPLLDLEGNCIGINIARADRTTTYAIRSEDVQRVYARLKGSSE